MGSIVINFFALFLKKEGKRENFRWYLWRFLLLTSSIKFDTVCEYNDADKSRVRLHIMNNYRTEIREQSAYISKFCGHLIFIFWDKSGTPKQKEINYFSRIVFQTDLARTNHKVICHQNYILRLFFHDFEAEVFKHTRLEFSWTKMFLNISIAFLFSKASYVIIRNLTAGSWWLQPKTRSELNK